MFNKNAVKGIQFGILSPEEIVSQSALEITESKSGSIKNSANDPRLGPISNSEACETCGKNTMFCPGHFGHIDLAIPVFHPDFIKPVIIPLLNCICFVCFNCVRTNEISEISDELSKIKGKNKLLKMADICNKSVKTCHNCGEPKFKTSYDKNNNVVCNGIVLEADSVRNILCQIPNNVLKIVGFNSSLIDDEKYKNKDTFPSHIIEHRHQNRPEWLIFTKFPVLPSCARPHSCIDGVFYSDDLTEMINLIVKTNNELKNPKKTAKKELTTVIKDKQYNLRALIANYIDNGYANTFAIGGNKKIKIIKAIKQRINGKEGRIRKEIQSKRNDFTARTVIGAGPHLKLNEVEIPQQIANVITIPEVVKDWNLNVANYLIEQNKVKYIKIKKSGKLSKYDLTRLKNYKITDEMVKQSEIIVIERFMQDGDIVILNRQPTLRNESMLGMICKIGQGKTFRFNLNVCQAFNADYDGDEMNIHVPQNPFARAEAYCLLNAKQHIMTPQRNAPIISPIQDSLLAGYLITASYTFITKSNAMQLALKSGLQDQYQDMLDRAEEYYPDYIRGGNIYTDKIPGKLLMSILFPRDFFYTRKTNVDNVENTVIIKKGIWVCGQGNKTIFGDKSQGVIHVLATEYGLDACEKYINAYCFLTVEWIKKRGFSVGIMDCECTNKEYINQQVSDLMLKCDYTLLKNIDKDKKEYEINNILNQATNVGQRLAEKEVRGGLRNAFTSMNKAGSKGKDINIAQILALVAQQNVKGARIPKIVGNKTRTLPHFECGDDGPIARGFVNECYLDGLSPHSTYFHAMGGREGVVATSCETASSGYAHRKIGKRVEDLSLRLDGTVRDGNGCVYQFVYGNQGLDPGKLLYPKIKEKTRHRLDKDINHSLPFFVDPFLIAKRIKYYSEYKFSRYLYQYEIDEILKTIILPGFYSNKACVFHVTQRLRYRLEDLLKQVKIVDDEQCVEEFYQVIKDRFNSAIISPGTVVGLIASASIGEPATQQTLNIFHMSGVSGKNVTLGMPRIIELLHLSKNPKNPSCTIFFKKEFLDSLFKNCSNNTEKYIKLKCHAQSYKYINIECLINSVNIKYVNKQPETTRLIQKLVKFKKHIPEEWEEIWKKYNDISLKDCSWVVEISFNIEKIFSARIDMIDVCNMLEESSNMYTCIPSPNDIGKIIVYINFEEMCLKTCDKLLSTKKEVTPKNANYFYTREVIIPFLKNFCVKGVPNIQEIYPENKDGEWIVETQGSNLLDLLSIPEIDATKTTCDNPWEIYEAFGLGATREFLIEELSRVLCFDGTYINPNHIELLVDTLLRKGTLAGIERYAQDKTKGPMGMACFEEAQKNIEHAAVFTEMDKNNSVSCRITMGSLLDVGPGIYFD